jgi:preprotein translocase subunit YajC
MFVSPAYAQAAGGGTGSGIEAFLPLVLIFVVFYFLLIRPQQKKQKQHRETLGAIRRGDRVVTGGGIMGTVTKVIDDNEVMVEITDGVKVRVQRGLIASVLAKTEPVKPGNKGEKPVPAVTKSEGGIGSLLGGLFGKK